MAEGADDRRSVDLRSRHVRNRRGGERNAPDPAAVALRARAALGVARMDDEAGGVVEDLAGEGIALGRRLPGRLPPAGRDLLAEPPAF